MNTTMSGEEDPQTPSANIRMIMGVVMFLMATVSSLGNFIIVFLYCAKPALKKNANLLIANIAVAGKRRGTCRTPCSDSEHGIILRTAVLFYRLFILFMVLCFVSYVIVHNFRHACGVLQYDSCWSDDVVQ